MSLPNELWLRIFASVTDAPTLKAILAISHRFHALGLEVGLRTVVWQPAWKTHSRVMEFLERPEKCRILRVLSLTLDNNFHHGQIIDVESGDLERIYQREQDWLRCLRRFSNLTSLTITGGQISPFYFDTFRWLRCLTEVKLQSCWVAAFPLEQDSDSDGSSTLM
ncbi:hypothetical protein DFH09DRAFT_1312156 [Mycena vulgaris]|nr:hypothetical protein DFH09DRAFT_1312156 [Mycena vulgaris]